MNKEDLLTQEYLKSVLNYDLNTGEFRWKINKSRRAKKGDLAGCTDINKSSGYTRIWINYKSYRAHRLAWLWMTGEWPQFEIDHKNRIRSDNRWNNLRPATNSQNKINGKAYKNNKSGYKGVYWNKNTKNWVASININKKQTHLGCFNSKKERV